MNETALAPLALLLGGGATVEARRKGQLKQELLALSSNWFQIVLYLKHLHGKRKQLFFI